MLTQRRIASGTFALLLGLQIFPGTSALAAGTISANPNPLALCVHATGTFKVMHGSATITASSNSSPSVAAINGSPSVASGGNLSVSALSVGSTTIGLTDTSSGTGSETVNVNGPISISSGNSVTFDGTASNGAGTGPQTITVSDPTASGATTTITATLGSGIASFSNTSTLLSTSKSTTNGQAQFTVYPTGSSSGNSASTSISLSDASLCTFSNAVSISVIPGTLSLSASNLTFTGLGSGNNQTFTAQEYNYAGTLTAASSNTTVATVTPATTPAPGAANSVTYTVTPVNYGKSTITVNDVRPASQTVSVLVSGGTISISGSKIAAFSTINDNTNQHLAATPVRVTGSVETTASGGANVYVLSPNNIVGSSGDLLNISNLTYNCTSNDQTKNQGGSFATGFLQLIANTAAANCLTFGNAGGAGQYADLDINVNLFLDDRTLPADSYSTATGQNSAFQVVLSAT